MRDLEFISGNFFDYEIPRNKKYLLKYFKTKLQIAFLRYYLIFGDYRNFKNHTGYHCNPRMLPKLKNKLILVVKDYENAKTSLTEEGMITINLIETGKYKLGNH